MSKAYVIVTLMICMAFTGCIEDDVEEDSATLKDSVYDVFDWGNTQNWKKWCSYILFTVEDNEIILANNTELDECAEDEDGHEFKFTVSNYTEENLDYRVANNSGFIYSVSAIIEGCERPDEFEPWDCVVNFGEDVDEFEMHWVEVGGQWVWWDNPWRGCTDSHAINYNSEAKDDDGTCEYYQFRDGYALREAVDMWKNGYSDGANSTYGDISRWDTSLVTEMSYMFEDVDNFNGDISDWDVSSVTNMNNMFRHADNFNSDISDWDVSSVTDMGAIFYDADNFSVDISGWNVSSVTNMDSMFGNTDSFNGDISDWDVSSVTSMRYMFGNTDSFNGDISDWDVSSVTTMNGMFWSISNFSVDISDWDVSSVTTMNGMFEDIDNFSVDISDWDVSSVTDMYGMFQYSENFNGDISGWDVSSVTTMNGMFKSAESFNQDISNWDVSSVTDMGAIFYGAGSFNQDISNWNVSNVNDMDRMFGEKEHVANLSDENKCYIHTEFSSNDNWSYYWEDYCSDD